MRLSALVVICCMWSVRAAIYDIDAVYDKVGTYMYSEGPMYSKDDTPWGSKESVIRARTTARWQQIGEDASGKTIGTLNVLLISDDTKNVVGYERSEVYGEALTKKGLCCTDPVANNCTAGRVFVSGKDVSTLLHLASFPLTQTSTSSDDFVTTEITYTTEVNTSGEQLVAFLLCRHDSDSEQLGTVVELSGDIEFENPYGYLAAISFGSLPFYFVMVVLYVILAVVFTRLVLKHKNEVLRLQMALLVVIFLGLFEVCIWFLFYLDLNASGRPACCPLHQFAFFAIGLNVLKRTISRCVLVAVCLGFGVVRPKLRRKTTVLICALGTAYFGLATNADIRINSSSYPVVDDFWTVPVTILDVVFVLWIYHGLTIVIEELFRLKQTVKLEMYKTLKRVLQLFVVMWVSFALFAIAVSKGSIALSWRHQWVLHSFWHLTYYSILVAVCVVWRPSEQSNQYAYSFQIPSSAEEAEAYEVDFETDTSLGVVGDEIELTSVATRNGTGVASGGRHGSDDDDDDEEEEEDEFGDPSSGGIRT